MSKVFVGNDIVMLKNFSSTLTSEFIQKVFTLEEVQYCQQFKESPLRFASTWAAKEAVYKIAKQITPDIILSWKKIEIKRKHIAGCPIVRTPSYNGLIDENLSLTLSHDGDYVWALACYTLLAPSA